MSLLSRAELFELVRELEQLGEKEERVDDALIRMASATVEAWQPIFGYSAVLLRHITAICGHLRNGLEGVNRYRARGVLTLISRELGRDGESMPLEGQVLAFVASLVAHELRELENVRVSYGPFQLSHEDRQAAEDILMRFYERPSHSDEELLLLSKRFADQHSRLRGSNFFGRLLLNLSNLERVLRADETNAEDRSWARAGLAYIVEADDAIDDRLGLLGLLDDAFVAGLVTSIVRPGSPPWTEILDQLYGAWPFIDEVVLHGEHAGRPMTEFLAVNAALACREIQANPERPLALVLPRAGPMPLLLGALSAIGLLQDWLRSTTSPLQFEIGQTVRLDNRVSAHFMGIKTFAGENRGADRVALRFWNKNGMEEKAYLPISDLPRLTPAESEERPRGPIDQTRKQISYLSALEHVFHLSRPRALFDIPGKIMLVAPVGQTRSLASEIHLCGFPLHSALPVGHRRADGQYQPWDNKYAALPPVLEIVPSLQQALQQIIKHTERISLIVIDLRGTNAGKIAEVDEIIRADVPLLLMTDEHEERALAFLEQEPISHWVWTPEDLESLVWPAPNLQPSVVGRYEDRMHLGAVAETHVVAIENPRVQRVFELLYVLRQYRSRQQSEGQEVTTDLSRAIALAESSTFPLLRMNPPSARCEQATQTLLKMFETADLTDDEVADLRLFSDAVEAARENLRDSNPREFTVLKLMTEDLEAHLLVRDEREREAVLESTGLTAQRVSSLAKLGGECVSRKLVVSGWFGRKRMARLLIPPAAASIFLVLSAIELRWFRSFQQRRDNFRRKHSRAEERAGLFPNLEWRARQNADLVDSLEHTPSSHEDRDDLHESRRHSVLAQERWSEIEGGQCKAHLVLFEGQSMAFLSPAFKVPVISSTHGRDATCSQESLVDELRCGDAIFLTTEGFDSLVDEDSAKILPPEAVAQSRLWHLALDRFLDEKCPGENFESGLSELQRRLKAEGCQRHLATIRAWIRSDNTIAPQNVEKDLAAIARATRDRALGDQLDACVAATKTIYQIRNQVKRGLRDEATGALRAALDRGEEAWETFEFRGAFGVVWIADIDPETRRVPRVLTNRVVMEE